MAPATGVAANELYVGKPTTVFGTEFPVASFAEGVTRGDAAWRNGDLDLALYLFVQALGFDGSSAEVFGKIGSIHERRGNLALAEKAFSLARVRAPKDARVLERLGLLYVQNGKNELAETTLRELNALSPGHWRSFDALGLVMQRRGEHSGAVAQFSQAVTLEPAAAPAYNHRGVSHLALTDITAAEADFRRALALGDVDEAAHNLASVVASRRDYAESLALLLRTESVPAAYNDLGLAAMTNKDYAAAIGYFEHAMSESPSFDERANRNLVLAREYQKQQQRVKPEIEPSIAKLLVGNATIRSEPSAQSSPLGYVTGKDIVHLLRCANNWCLVAFHSRVRQRDEHGWILASLLVP